VSVKYNQEIEKNKQTQV